ncbi:hypothetical protein DL96DRAFT_1009822 [Flagelloscypha sp. PMI_526]|nr:hypothetical protein DL96DRAFT_1009822 [Flagelloscypha sp. PMI_526]
MVQRLLSTILSLQDIATVTFSIFSTSESEEARSLASVASCLNGRTSTLKLLPPWSSHFSLDLHCLQSFSDIQYNLRYLHFGMNVYRAIMNKIPVEFESTDLLPLNLFLRLETITIPVHILSTEDQWDYWWMWLKTVVTSAYTCPVPSSFRVFRFPVSQELSSIGTFYSVPHALDHFHDKLSFCLEFIVPSSAGNEKIEQVFTLVRSTFPSWESGGGLEFRVEIFRPNSCLLEME